MTLSSFGKILTVLDLFSVSRPIINVDLISEELGLSKPTSYRYLKELVSAELLQRLSGTSGITPWVQKLQFWIISPVRQILWYKSASLLCNKLSNVPNLVVCSLI